MEVAVVELKPPSAVSLDTSPSLLTYSNPPMAMGVRMHRSARTQSVGRSGQPQHSGTGRFVPHFGGDGCIIGRHATTCQVVRNYSKYLGLLNIPSFLALPSLTSHLVLATHQAS